MRRALILWFLALAPVAQAQTFDSHPFLSVQGHAEAKVKPDIFPVTVTLEETGSDAAKAQGLIEDLAAKTLAAAEAQGAKDADIDVGNLSVSPETKWDDKGEREVFLGNTYEREIEVRFQSLDAVRGFIAALPDMKQLKIQTGEFKYSGSRELQRKLRREAIADARAAADDMAAAVGKRLGALFNVSDRAQSTIYSNMGYAGGRAPLARSAEAIALLAPGAARSAGIVLKEGEITVSADAYLVYLIAD
jgi:uncharacterized protein